MSHDLRFERSKRLSKTVEKVSTRRVVLNPGNDHTLASAARRLRRYSRERRPFPYPAAASSASLWR